MTPAETDRAPDVPPSRSDASPATNRGGPRSRISEYALLEFLGEGSTAHVYLAEHVASGARVAVKMVDKLLVRRARLEPKVRQEMVLHARLRHPHVLRVRDAFEDARNYYLVLELCERGSLAALARSLPGRRLPEPLAKQLFRAMKAAAGVAYLHAQGVIHRDLKLANLLLTAAGELKISDFGLATRASGDHWTICGTPNFIAPEVLRAGAGSYTEADAAGSYTEAVDLWSLGCILHCLLLGRAPFEGRKVSETLENVANAATTALSFPRGFSASAADLIKRLLTSDPERRPSAQQVLLHPWLRESQRPRPARATSKRATRTKRTAAARPTAVDGASDGHLSSVSSAESHPARRRSARGRSPVGFDASGDDTATPIARPRSRSRTRKATSAGLYRAGVAKREEDSSSDDMSSVDYGDGAAAIDESSDVSAVPSSLFAVESLSDGADGAAKRSSPASASLSDRASDDDAASSSSSRRSDASALYRRQSLAASAPTVSVVLRFDARDVPCLEIPPDRSASVELACHEPQEVGGPLAFALRVSNGFVARYELSSGALTATTTGGDAIAHRVSSAAGTAPAASGAAAGASPAPSFPVRSLVRLCQRLAMRVVELRGRALRQPEPGGGPRMVHYDRLPASILDGVRARAVEAVERQVRDELRGPARGPSTGRELRSVAIRGVGTGAIDAAGDLRVAFTDGSRLTLAANGQELRFRPPPAAGEDEDEDAADDVFELLSASPSSAFLPTAVTTKLARVPEFIQQLKR